jgi:uncharacterized protein
VAGVGGSMVRERAGALARRHAIWFSIVATLVWVGLILAAIQLPPHPLYGPMYVNAIGFGAGLIVIWLLGWRPADVGLGRQRFDRSLWLLAPLFALTLTYALPGIEGEPYIVFCTAVWCLLIGLNEELWSRGIILYPLSKFGPFPSALLVALLFSNQHWLNYLFFGAELEDQFAQLISTFTFAFVLVALRWRGLTIWPLAILHGLGDFLQLTSPGAAPWWWQLAIALFELAYGWWLLHAVHRSSTAAPEARHAA